MSDDNRNRNAAGNWGHCIGTWDASHSACDDQVDALQDWSVWLNGVIAANPAKLSQAIEFGKRVMDYELFKPKKQIRKFEL